MKDFLLNYWWAFAVFIWYLIYHIFSKLNNDFKNSIWFWATMISGLCPLWAWVSKYSKNIVFDGIFYNFLIIMSFFFAMLMTNATKPFSLLNYVGFVLAIAGLILLRV